MSHFLVAQTCAGNETVDPDALSHQKQGAVSECRRCGICCKKGGPTFHLEDKSLIDGGIISMRHLYTVREGEFARDELRGGVFPVATDLIKIKGEKGSFRCLFLSEKDNRCMIYEIRPVECRTLKCWDTAGIESLYGKKLLTRKHVITRPSALWELVTTHQRLCSYESVRRCIDKLMEGNRKREAVHNLAEIIRNDVQTRETATEKAGVDPESLDFLFGRPLAETLKPFGFRI